ncbi:MAG TPA: signal peptidase I [Anaerolineaceae bacterium]|nr:signal peptidase I [Anaerolineaceae bacterium]HNS37307.1 signal peptidase I [Anaerolineaceae bacterium]HNZ12236.1 signal peptidase I [Anaerolineaceae bacterium]HOD03725.1 signal peptidase I [Anaerolineaceae bacterium]HOG78209.1 signal peptidase I [Anaerolineaceae bacterium]
MEDYRAEPVAQDPPEVKKKPAWKTFLSEVLQTLLLAAVLYFLIDSMVGRVRVENISMQPTLKADELLLVNKLAYRLGNMHHGDIVVFHYPGNPTEDYIKRLIGLPGDEVRVENGQVLVNGYALTEPYIAAPPSYTGVWNVPEGSVFVLGDNRNQSSDSHSWGFVPIENLLGRALVIYWPLNEVRLLNGPDIVNAASTP